MAVTPERVLQQNRESYARHRESVRAAQRAYYQRNADAIKARIARWVAANPERVAQNKGAYRHSHRPDLRQASRRRYNADKGKHFSYAAARRARKRHALPKWADREAIKMMYTRARAMTEATGIVHEVDHIYPLLGRDVCGLHVHNNLRIVTQTANRSKGNKYPGDA